MEIHNSMLKNDIFIKFGMQLYRTRIYMVAKIQNDKIIRSKMITAIKKKI